MSFGIGAFPFGFITSSFHFGDNRAFPGILFFKQIIDSELQLIMFFFFVLILLLDFFIFQHLMILNRLKTNFCQKYFCGLHLPSLCGCS